MTRHSTTVAAITTKHCHDTHEVPMVAPSGGSMCRGTTCSRAELPSKEKLEKRVELMKMKEDGN